MGLWSFGLRSWFLVLSCVGAGRTGYRSRLVMDDGPIVGPGGGVGEEGFPNDDDNNTIFKSEVGTNAAFRMFDELYTSLLL